MSKIHGIGKPHIECKCDYNFTCGYCLRNAPPYIFTPSTVTEQAAYKADTPPDDENARQCPVCKVRP